MGRVHGILGEDQRPFSLQIILTKAEEALHVRTMVRGLCVVVLLVVFTLDVALAYGVYPEVCLTRGCVCDKPCMGDEPYWCCKWAPPSNQGCPGYDPTVMGGGCGKYLAEQDTKKHQLRAAQEEEEKDLKELYDSLSLKEAVELLKVLEHEETE